MFLSGSNKTMIATVMALHLLLYGFNPIIIKTNSFKTGK